MNKRIRELVEQAVKAVDNPFPGNPLNDELAKMYITDCFAEKFAELIIWECMRMCEVAQMGYLTHGLEKEASGAMSVNKYIEEHFGVEE